MLYDTWSLSILLREFDTLYRAFCSGKRSPLPEPTIQIADFAVWQRRYLDPGSSSFQAQLGYWRKKLPGTRLILKLPCERAVELMTASLQNVVSDLEIPTELSAVLRSLARRESVTLFMTFLAASKALINLSTGQNDIMLGAHMAKRSAPESDRMMGYFTDTCCIAHRGFIPSQLSRVVKSRSCNGPRGSSSRRHAFSHALRRT